ncbi:MAG: hypothetical protein H0U74_12350 [Bradymonadaceae bacterium]|nr:hypothetical protein [Lujinxingiaceae bacterium]
MEPRCRAGLEEACTCDDGAIGSRSCRTSGTMGTCSCEDDNNDSDTGANNTNNTNNTNNNNTNNTSGDTGSNDTGGGGDDTSHTTDDTGGGEDDTGVIEPGEYALGSIVLTARTGGDLVSATASAFFVPDASAAAAPSCALQIGGCWLSQYPDCPDGCEANEYCAFTAGCAGQCKRACDLSCANDEECYFPVANNPACRKTESFNAGNLNFTGTTEPLTLSPPYSFSNAGGGSLFTDASTITVRANGSTAAGFAGFEQSFTTTKHLQSSPSNVAIGLGTIFGEGPVEFNWEAGSDSVTLTAIVTSKLGRVGVLSCSANDASGGFSLPRSTIDAAIDDEELASLSFHLTRTRTETRSGLVTRGTLNNATVQPVGRLHLTSSSTESGTFLSCILGEDLCGDTCADLTTSRSHCGECSNNCVRGDNCGESKCFGPGACTSCRDDVTGRSGADCTSANQTCNNDPACTTYRTCLAACTTNICRSVCGNTAGPTAIQRYQAVETCVCKPTNCGHQCEC